MLTGFKVKGYRCFANEVSLDLANTRNYAFNCGAVRGGIIKDALVYGSNAVGKSNLGRALFDVSDSMRYDVSRLGEHDPSYLNADSGTQEAEFSYKFRFGESTAVYSYAKSDKYALLREFLFIDGDPVYGYDFAAGTWEENFLSEYGAGGLNYEYMDGSMPVLRYVCNNVPPESLGVVGLVYDFVVHMRRTTEPERDFRDILRIAVARIVATGAVGRLQSFLGAFGINESLAVHTDPSGLKTLYFEKSRPIPFIENCSSGIGALVRLFRALYMEGGASFLYVDEFDAFYHFSLAEAVVAFLRDNVEMQVIAATHNTDLFSNRALRPDCLFVLSREGMVSAADATRRELREGHNLEKLYKAGEFDNASAAVHC